ncbi:uncharacterized protein LOC131162156 [Malania oleifera]|uniref:uncharacterized protein LOC131162156 n=1 Tax=Malania oleifera TaxID=397392 RepID=UPI0025AE0FFD|nr:uncharacterized protein LOC131162156 [Malania oleifera]
MPSEAVAAQFSGSAEKKAHAFSAARNEEAQVLRDVVRSLPSHAVTDLLSVGVCIRCILRLFGFRGHIFSCSFLSTSVLCSVIGELTSLDRNVVDGCLKASGDSTSPHTSHDSESNPVYCIICFGILQFTYRDDSEMLMYKDCANGLAASIADLVKQEGHQIDNFSLEVSVPPIVVENENAVWFYMEKKYGSELWFQEKFLSERISAKDALKLSITNALEKLLDVKSGLGSLRIRLTYTHTKASMKVQNFSEAVLGCKKKKTECSDFSGSEIDSRSRDHELTKHPHFLPEKVCQACCLTYLCYRTPTYIGGRYVKYSRNVSQTRWVIEDERMGEASVEEIIGSNILPMCRGDNYKFHAAGREDIDVRMLGPGRPFLLEIQNARDIPSEVFIKDMERKINNLENKLVKVKHLRVMGSEGWSLMHEGEAEKQKQYAAVVWISRPLKDEDLRTISSLKDMGILQRTPIRVLHRRSPLERQKIIHWMKIERIAGSSQYFLLHLCTQAGTYIKEFVHGDLGRTHPNIGSILGCRAEILQLDVTDVKMDSFPAK